MATSAPPPPPPFVPDSPASPDTATPLDAETPQYRLPVDEHGRATVIRLYYFGRPHMRAFYFALFSLFVSQFGFVSPTSFLIDILSNPRTAWLNSSNFRNQNYIALGGLLFMSIAIGPVCDRFGPRVAQTFLLAVLSIPLFLLGTSNSFAQWATARFFIGSIGAASVVAQFWASIMFSSNIVATANALVAGWGSLGSDATIELMPRILNGIRNSLGFDPPSTCLPPDFIGFGCQDPSLLDVRDKAWRIAIVIPAFIMLLFSITLWFLSDDLPAGNYTHLIKSGVKQKTGPHVAIAKALINFRVWILSLLHAGNFGVQLIVRLILSQILSRVNGFNLDRIVLFVLLRLISRPLGGIASDIAATRFGLNGRLCVAFVTQALGGAALILFSRVSVLGGVIAALILFFLLTDMAAGATFGIVPFIDPLVTGSVTGLVSVGANIFALAVGFWFLRDDDTSDIRRKLLTVGLVVIGSAFLVPLLKLPQYYSTFREARSKREDIETGDTILGYGSPPSVDA